MGTGRHRGEDKTPWSSWSTLSRTRRRRLLLAMLSNQSVPTEDLVRARQRAVSVTSRLRWSMAQGVCFAGIALLNVHALTPWTPGTVALAAGGLLAAAVFVAGVTFALLLRRWLRTHG